MAFLTLSMYSEVLSMDTNVNVLLPERRKGEREELHPDRKYPVLYCLHGHGDDHTAWIRKSNIEIVARDYGVVVVMPTVQRGFYADSEQGFAYYTYITQELPVKMANFFPISMKPEDTFLMGNSMGAYGALRIALLDPARYAAVAALSVALPQVLYKYHNEFTRGMELALGPEEQLAGSDRDILTLVDRLAQREGATPKIYACCGTEDWISYEGFQLLDRHIKEHAPALNYQSSTNSGGHNWDFWNPHIRKAVEQFGFPKNE